MLSLHLVLLLLVSRIGYEPEVQQHYRKKPVCEDIVAKIENKSVACEIEQALRKEGFKDPMIEAVLLNSYAESKFSPSAVGDGGRSRGVFQLHERGLGMKMTKESRHDVEKSTQRIIIAIRKSKKLNEAIERDAKASELTELFCTEIMRPSNKSRKATQRVKLRKELFTPTERRQSGTKEGTRMEA